MDFIELIDEKLAQKLRLQGIVAPTDIQRRAMPVVLDKKDVIAQSATGTGKTLAYLLPIFARLDGEIKGAQAIVVAPTHELASQIAKVAQGLAESPSDVVLIIGSANKTRQIEALKGKPKVIVGSVGRIVELIGDKKLSVHHVKTLVFDEADRLFDEENMGSIGKLVKSTLRERQILLFSASMPEKTIELATPLMKEPEILHLDENLPPNIQHFYIITEPRGKFDAVRKLVHAENMTQGIVFVNIPFTIEKVSSRLNFHKLAAVPLYGAAEKAQRKQAIDTFRGGRARLLVASDIGSRGLDIQDLTYIINLDLPDNEKDYLHRAGRCGRMGRGGIVVSVVTPGEVAVLQRFAKKLGINVLEKVVAHGKLMDKRMQAGSNL